MDYLETSIGRVAKYSHFLHEWSRDCLDDSLENDELLKIFNRSRKTIDLIGKHYFPNTPKQKYLNRILNGLYNSLRNINSFLTDYEKSSIFLKDKYRKDLQNSLLRINYIIEDYYESMKRFDKKNKSLIPSNFNPGKVSKNKTMFYLNISSQKNLLMSCEYIFVNMVQHKDMVYYVETNDVFNFFYFYRTDECWFWSPPKKTDPEDIWIECPKVRIEEGYWTGKIIPPFMAEFIMWLYLFFPKIPKEYLRNDVEDNSRDNNKTKQKGNDNQSKNQSNDEDKHEDNENKDKDKNCTLF